MNLLNRNAKKLRRGKTSPRNGAAFVSAPRHAFTLIELILVLSLLVVITSITLPAMSRFVRGRALDSEARRLLALTHVAQSRAVSEGMPMMLWVDEKNDAYGVAAESSGQSGAQSGAPSGVAASTPNSDLKAENLTVDATLAISVMNLGAGAQTTFNSLPAIRFQPDGTVDENSPQTLKLMDEDGFARLLTETRLRTGYEITDATTP
jgi:prepilin-type N-terminal cleavage/methylation domain-containing protein